MAEYSEDKPKNCRYCYFYLPGKGCYLKKENCYYKKTPKKKVITACNGCPYGAHAPCIGYCMQKILKEFRHEL